ncbi:MAG: hypothetical protein OXC06_15530 [Acidimicrobiaceae bacterium]|nr:hypothetical protein [Acidimicrobiaceae bacterium]
MGTTRVVKPTGLADYLIERGDRVVTTEQVAALLGVRLERVSRSLAVPRRDKRMLSVTKGLWAPVSPARRAAGTNPPVEYIGEMMSHLGHRYCLGYRSAAAMYGAAHFGWGDLQVITTARLRSRRLGAWPVMFVTRPDLDRLPVRSLARAGATVEVASPETTVFDLIARPDLALGFSRTATLVAELLTIDALDGAALASAARLHPAAVVRRGGLLVDRLQSELAWDMENPLDLEPLAGYVKALPQRTVRLSAGRESCLRLDSGAGERVDARWGVLVDMDIEYSV